MSKRLSPIAVFLMMILVLLASPARAQNAGGPDALVVLPGVQSDGPAPAAGPAFGVSTNSAVTYAAHAFVPIDSSAAYAYGLLGGNLALYHTGGSYYFEAPVHLPTGSLIQSVEFRFCDTNATSGFNSYLTINDKTGAGGVSQPAMVSSTAGETPGCINRTFTPASPIQVDNDTKAYTLEANLGAAGDSSIVLCQARIYYRLQVSPAPAVATFTDVPTSHPFFRFVEALVSAGITGGCGSGLYCPNNPVTRGQMAVFLSAALGLHFPN